MYQEKICPYPGLRPFNEEESIFFRGREEHIEKITRQLEEKKFLMLTGASGDGKSSIVYAGIIPNARAGFFKAKFNSWLIADFRPERSPLKNLAQSLSEKLGYTDVDYVEKELGYGFSSLINLYKKSAFFLDVNAADYIALQEPEQKKKKRKAANLYILVDQFEEFFTNSENYNNGKPSVTSQLVVNLLLETARIALAEDLPIYIVCTMRSDYIGQCAVFRGLPEYIGYSQFFIPRLKRKEIHQVIEEPATLSGNQISNRLIETLINDCDGQDQLPILQHALNQIWKSHAQENAVQMDIIHYAKVGGIDSQLIPDDEQGQFKKWHTLQSPYKQKLLENASLSNVLNLHARELFENAGDYYVSYTGKKITKEEAQLLLKQIFTCLTKINDSKAVRNRATVLEVKQILGGNIDNSMIEGLVNLYRESNNTLLKPFINTTAEPASPHSKALKDADILDITHESLIRNWADLTEWTKQDNENVSILEDFKKQVIRWETKKRSTDYLLTIGSLSYFKAWYKQINPNPHLLAKYDLSVSSPDAKVEEAKLFIASAKAFLKISEANIKRTRRLVIFVAASIALILIGFSSWAYKERNEAIRKSEEVKQAETQARLAEAEANDARARAILSKDQAQINEKHALTSQKEALSAKARAEQAAKEAHQSFIVAQQNAEIAKSETQKANVALSESEKAKQEAIVSKNAAEKAQKYAYRIGLLSLAQSLALKSNIYRTDPQLQALLALQAYSFNIENGGDARDPQIYSALRNSYLDLSVEAAAPKMISSLEQKTALFMDEKILISADKGGSVYKWDLAIEKMLEKGQLKFPIQKELLKQPTPIEFVSLVLPNNRLISGHKDGKICIWDISTVSKPSLVIELPAHLGEVCAADFNLQKQFFVTGAKDSSIIVWKYSEAKTEKHKVIKTVSAVHDLVYLPDGQTILVTLNNGALVSIDIDTEKTTTLFQNSASKAWCLKLNEKKNLLAVGFTDGKVRVFDLAKNVQKGNEIFLFEQNNTAVEKLVFNKTNDWLAFASADKSIKVLHLNKKNQKAQEIKDIKSKTRFMLFDSQNMLYTFGADHVIRKIELSTEKLANFLCEKLTRNLSEEEWKRDVSESVPYEKTCKNKW